MTAPDPSPLLVPGRTCWRIERAERLAFVVDAADYFRHAKAAMLRAEHSILLIGWEFDLRIQFEPEGQTLEGPNELGPFLFWLPKNRPNLRVYVLKWDLGAIEELGRGVTPFTILGWTAQKRLRFKLDGAHPPGSAHHQKIAVIDDAVAFCGGIDMTADRWDTPEHRDDDPRRRRPSGRAYMPWHDAATVVDGAAARALGDLARARWHAATGERLDPPPPCEDVWPDPLEPVMRGVEVGIARTLPMPGKAGEVREIEALYLAAIARARRMLYFESQYLASRRIAEALAARLAEPDGPEIAIVLPKATEGWLEHKAMDGARVRLLRLLWRADRHRRLGVFYPVTEGGNPIYVHAKITIVDDWLLRVGSSNLNNRSLGYDTECDLAVEIDPASPEGEPLSRTIRAIRRDLLCEHLGATPPEFEAALDRAGGSLLRTIAALGRPGRGLVRFRPEEIEEDASPLAENELLDPETTAPTLGRRLRRGLPALFAGLAGRRTA